MADITPDIWIIIPEPIIIQPRLNVLILTLILKRNEGGIIAVLPSEQSDTVSKANLDTTSSPEKADVADKDQVVAPKEEVQAQPDKKKKTDTMYVPI